VVVEGKRGGKKKALAWELLDYFDEKRGISAMERATGFSLAITGMMQVRQQVTRAGVLTPDEAMPPDLYIKELSKRGVEIRPIKV
jgi:lysine 6-dehydrogenase